MHTFDSPLRDTPLRRHWECWYWRLPYHDPLTFERVAHVINGKTFKDMPEKFHNRNRKDVETIRVQCLQIILPIIPITVTIYFNFIFYFSFFPFIKNLLLFYFYWFIFLFDFIKYFYCYLFWYIFTVLFYFILFFYFTILILLYNLFIFSPFFFAYLQNFLKMFFLESRVSWKQSLSLQDTGKDCVHLTFPILHLGSGPLGMFLLL